MLATVVGWQWGRIRDDVTVLRGPEDAFAVRKLSWQSDGSMRVSWPPQAGATVYRVRLVASSTDGVSEQVKDQRP